MTLTWRTTSATAAVPGLALERLSWRAGGRLIVDGVDITAPAGTVTGVLGPNGSGKTTLLRLIIGALPASSGALLLDGRDLGRFTRRARARRIALVEQDSPTAVPLRALDVVLLGRTPYRSPWQADTNQDRDLARTMLARVGAGHLADREISTLSGGERQRVHLARALAQTPSVLLLDEPTNHLDIAAQLGLLRLVAELESVTTLMALHDLNHALRACAHVVVLDRGRVVAAGPPAEVLTPALLEQVYRVRAEIVVQRGRPYLAFSEL